MTTKYTEWKIESVIALVVAFSFIASFAYLFGFFLEINVSISSIPISINDILISFYYWVCPTLMVLAVIHLLMQVSSLFDKDVLEEDIIRNARNPKMTRFKRQAPFYFLFTVFVFCTAYFFFFSIKQKGHIYLLGSSIGFLVIIFYAEIYKLPYEKARFLELIKYPIILFISLLTIAITIGFADGFQFFNSNCDLTVNENNQKNSSYFWGITFGKNIVEPEKKIYDIDFKNNNFTSQCSRYIDKGLIVNSSKKIIFFPWESIRKININ
jgi:hypothetical protein